MKDPITRKKKTSIRPEEPGHLDETLTEITTTTAETFKRWRPWILSLLAVIAVVIAVSAVLNSVEEGRAESLNQRLYEVFDAPALRDPDFVPSEDAVAACLAAVKGTEVERPALKRAATYYLDRVEKMDESAKEGAKAGESAQPPAERGALLDKALKLANEAAEDYPDDTDLQKWAADLRARIEGERKTGWLPPARKYEPLPVAPQAGAASSGSGAASPEAAAQAPAGAGESAPTPPPESPETTVPPETAPPSASEGPPSGTGGTPEGTSTSQ